MRQSWDDYEKASEAGPLAIGIKAILGLAVLGLIAWAVFGACAAITGTVNETASVTREQFGPRASLAKYEWFKDAAAQLDKKRADLVLYERRMKRCETTAHADERERCGIWESEMLGIAASYNSLAAEYNAASSKFNWSYAGRADLPREIAPYNTGAK